MHYDFLIVGAGIAGLHCGLELLKRDKDLKICILEQYDYVGGRMLTHHQKGMQWEIASARFSDRHPMLLSLIKKYKLTKIPIGNGTETKFTDLIPTYMDPLHSLSPQKLATHTLGELLTQVHGTGAHDFLQLFPYWSEIWTLRADLGIRAFASEFSGSEKFFVCKEGIQSVAHHMQKEYEALGGMIQLNVKVLDVQEGVPVCVLVQPMKYEKGSLRPMGSAAELQSNHCILAMPVFPLKKLPSVHIPALKHLTMEPLIRMYAVFPVVKGKSWFSFMEGNQVFPDNVIRYFIPIHAAKGLCMISYTDGDDARYWIKMLDTKHRPFVQDKVMKEIRLLFPDLSIPEPTEFHTYPWHDGCSYWRPGLYDPEAMCKSSLRVSKHVSACGESLSMRQAWIEGALESAAELVKQL
jgi:monoamine oxidase